MSESVLIDTEFQWRSEINELYTIDWIGDDNSISKVKQFFDSPQSDSCIEKRLLGCLGHFAGIVETKDRIYGFVDIIRSSPIFYNAEKFRISNSARFLKKNYKNPRINSESALEFAMAGYVTGGYTICDDIHQLQAGEFLIYDKQNQSLTVKRYFKYFPQNAKSGSKKKFIYDLSELIDHIFLQIIEKHNGAPIWVPLSGGYDSRLVICKLHSLGYKKLYAFTYGPKWSAEVKIAKTVTDRLGVPWIYIDTNSKRNRDFFKSSSRKEFWKRADGLSCCPTMNDYAAILRLTSSSKISPDAVIINGQSGDFLTGGHIPFKPTVGSMPAQRVADAIVSKHFSLWQDMKSKGNIFRLEKKLFKLLELEKETLLNAEELASNYEQWEWQERQSKLVVNGQRLYDFFRLKWELPLWHPELVHYWLSVPLNLRYKQSLFIEYLKTFNYKGLFNDRCVNPETLRSFKHNLKQYIDYAETKFLKQGIFSKYTSYWGYYYFLYSFYGANYFFHNISNASVPPEARGVVALGVKIWFEENGFEFPSYSTS